MGSDIAITVIATGFPYLAVTTHAVMIMIMIMMIF